MHRISTPKTAGSNPAGRTNLIYEHGLDYKMKFSRCSDNGTKIEIEMSEHASMDEVLDEFQNFLRGCGYVIEYNQCLTFVDMDK
jgi:hypothetical protein